MFAMCGFMFARFWNLCLLGLGFIFTIFGFYAWVYCLVCLGFMLARFGFYIGWVLFLCLLFWGFMLAGSFYFYVSNVWGYVF